jgi:hypothetical protein
MSKQLFRFLASFIGLSILGITLLLPPAISAPSRVEYKSSITPPTNTQVEPMTLPKPVFRRWTHSREEDRGDILVYRPNDYSFPPARGREGLEFCENGDFLYYSIGPTDRSLAVPGQWSIQQTNAVDIQFADQSIPSFSLAILECTEQILKVRRMTTEPTH